MEISEYSNELDGCKGLDRDCLKVGPSNDLLTYHAIYFLDRLGGYKVNQGSIALLLASHYLHKKSEIEKLIDTTWANKKSYHESRKLYDSGKTTGLSKEINAIRKIKTYEEKFKPLESDVLRNVKRSLRTLHEKDLNVVKKEFGHYIALGNAVETAEGCVGLPDRPTYAKTISRIREFNKWMSKAG